MAQVLPVRRKEEHDGSFMPIVGDGRKALMVNVIAEFKPLQMRTCERFLCLPPP